MKANSFSFSKVSRSYELSPVTSQKSFYGKANVYIMRDGTTFLRSYATIVAGIDKSGNVKRFWGGWSATTGKHIKAFCGMNKAQFTSIPLSE